MLGDRGQTLSAEPGLRASPATAEPYGPLVSICIPTCNGEAYLDDALTSAMRQTYRNLEIVVSDDASADATLRIARSYQAESAIPFHIFEHVPSGIGANWNSCARRANGTYIKFLFQDDRLAPDCVAKMVALAERDERIGLVFCRRKIIVEQESGFTEQWIRKFSVLHTAWPGLEEINSGRRLLKRCARLLKHPSNKVGEPIAVLLRAAALRRVDYFNEGLEQLLDIELWYRIFFRYKVGFIDEELAAFRLQQDQASQKNQGRVAHERDVLEDLMYRELFWALHRDVQLALFRKKSRVYRWWRRLGKRPTFG